MSVLLFDTICFHLGTIPQRDGQTDIWNCYNYIRCVTLDKNEPSYGWAWATLMVFRWK